MDQDTRLDMTSPPEAPDASAIHAPDDAPWYGQEGRSFRLELARAMQAAGDRHREHFAAALRQYADGHAARTRARGEIENGELRRMAEEDVAAIRTWCDAEIARIQDEATRRVDERNQDLDDVLARHGLVIDAEIEAVAQAIRTYQLTLDAHFDDMAASPEPAYIARQAGFVPPPPDLEVVRGDARAKAVEAIAVADRPAPPDADDPARQADPVGVMDPAAIGAVAALPGENGTSEAETAESPIRANAAVRLIRSFVSITGQSAPASHDHREQPR